MIKKFNAVLSLFVSSFFIGTSLRILFVNEFITTDLFLKFSICFIVGIIAIFVAYELWGHILED